jgi:hypothetical protein
MFDAGVRATSFDRIQVRKERDPRDSEVERSDLLGRLLGAEIDSARGLDRG